MLGGLHIRRFTKFEGLVCVYVIAEMSSMVWLGKDTLPCLAAT
jgi:hypothetical protein